MTRYIVEFEDGQKIDILAKDEIQARSAAMSIARSSKITRTWSYPEESPRVVKVDFKARRRIYE